MSTVCIKNAISICICVWTYFRSVLCNDVCLLSALRMLLVYVHVYGHTLGPFYITSYVYAYKT